MRIEVAMVKGPDRRRCKSMFVYHVLFQWSNTPHWMVIALHPLDRCVAHCMRCTLQWQPSVAVVDGNLRFSDMAQRRHHCIGPLLFCPETVALIRYGNECSWHDLVARAKSGNISVKNRLHWIVIALHPLDRYIRSLLHALHIAIILIETIWWKLTL